MGKIKQLPRSVSNQISAGEVVERPASVVKELVENSIDAECSNILIDIKNGGKDKIRVKDNGKGIMSDDLKLAFSRYATSKIDSINDLYSIKTLGFRGEALASIASVSEVEIRSKTKDENKGNYMKLKGGKIITTNPIGAAKGTDITVTNLFYNTPARYKYLKTTNTEFGHISSIVNREALACPDIKFSLKHNGNTLFKTPGSGKMLDTIISIYGKELADSLVAVDYKDRYIYITGYIAKPTQYRSSRKYEIFFVNNRTVNNLFLNKGVELGYKGLLPPRKRPVVFLNLKLNQILVDVNVHPSKREIKFSRNEIIQDVITKGVKNTLKNVDLSPRFNIKNKTKKKNKKQSQHLDFSKNNTEQHQYNIENKAFSNKSKDIKLNNNIYSNSIKEDKYNRNNDSKCENNKNNNIAETKDNELENNISNNDNNYNETIAKTLNNNEKKQYTKNNQLQIDKIMGQIDNTYILAEADDGLLIIDQHNAHERILYDKLFKKYNKKNVKTQGLLVPININATLTEMEVINKYKNELDKLGIKIENFGGNSIVVQEIPVLFKKRSAEKVIKEIIDNLIDEGKVLSQSEIIQQIITYMACRGAVKAGNYLDKKEIKKLVEDLNKTSNPYRCPHGRPIVIHLSKDDIEKGMGRK